jgi:AraC-like DNA-binding protein
MFWSVLFVIGIVQGLFLIGVFTSRSNSNRLACRLLIALLALFVLSNFDDLLLSSGWYKAAPWLFGFSMGAMFAYGPLFYLYIRSVTDPGFGWSRREWLHFVPAGLSLLWNFGWLLAPSGYKIRYLDAFIAGTVPVGLFDGAVGVFQLVYLCCYLWLAFRAIRRARGLPENGFKVSMPQRADWLHKLFALFSLILVALELMIFWNFFHGFYTAGANYVFTIATSAILYFIAYKLMLNPELVTPGFSKKYQTVRMDESEEQGLLRQLGHLLEKEKIFTDPDLKLATLAERLNTPPHRLSMLVNEQHSKSFSDFINQYRVDEFIARLNQPAYANYTLHGLALEVGFNSKSAFNAAFKKLTGKNPSDFKKSPVTP